MDTDEIADLINQIRHGTDVERKKAWKRVAWGGEDAIPPLISLLDSENKDIRHASVSALSRMSGPHVVDTLYQVLAHESNIYSRGRAIIGLFNCAGLAFVPEAIKLLDNHERGRFRQDKRLCEYAAEGLMKVGTPELLLLVEDWAIVQLSREDFRDKVSGIYILKSIGTHRCIPALRRSLSDEQRVEFEYSHQLWSWDVGKPICELAASTMLRASGRNIDIQHELGVWAKKRMEHEDACVRYHALDFLHFDSIEQWTEFLQGKAEDKGKCGRGSVGEGALWKLEEVKRNEEIIKSRGW